MKVLLVGDLRLFREVLARALEANPSYRVWECGSRKEGLRKAARNRFDAVVVDYLMFESLLTISELNSVVPAVRVIVVAVPERNDEVKACIEAGASGYLTRSSTIEDIYGELEGVDSFARYRREPLRSSKLDSLTKQEVEVARLICRGLSNKELSRVLGIAVSTAKNHAHNTFCKLGVQRRSELVARYSAYFERERLL